MKEKSKLTLDVNVDDYVDMVVTIVKLKEHLVELQLKLDKAHAVIKKQHKELVG